jgi:hypothetical protein
MRARLWNKDGLFVLDETGYVFFGSSLHFQHYERMHTPIAPTPNVVDRLASSVLVFLSITRSSIAYYTTEIVISQVPAMSFAPCEPETVPQAANAHVIQQPVPQTLIEFGGYIFNSSRDCTPVHHYKLVT